MDTLFSTLVPNFFLSVGNNTLTKQANTTILDKIIGALNELTPEEAKVHNESNER